jgi:hypothetical protein
MNAQRSHSAHESDAYDAALLAAIADWRAEATRVTGPNRDRLAAIKAVILSLAAIVRPERAALLLTEVEGAPSLIPARSRGGPIYDNIVQFLPKQHEWDIPQAKAELDRRGVQAEKKDVQNVFGYLARDGRVRRVGRGRYLVNGALLITSDEIGGEPTRCEDD